MIIDKEDNLKFDLNQTSYKSSDIKALTRKLVYNKNVSAEPIGFICFLIPILLSIVLSIIESIFPKIAFFNGIAIIVGLIISAIVICYIFMKGIRVIQKKKVGIKCLFSTNAFIIFFIALIIFGIIMSIISVPISDLLNHIFDAKTFFASSLHSHEEFSTIIINTLLISGINLLVKVFVLYIVGIILFLFVFNIFVFPAYLCIANRLPLFDALKTGTKLSFLNIKKLFKIEFSFFHIIFFMIPIPLLFIWKGLYIFTAILVVVEKSLESI